MLVRNRRRRRSNKLNKEIEMLKRAIITCLLGGGLILILLFTVRLYKVALDPAKYGIITLEGWEHGVALCQADEPDEEMFTQEDEFHVWQEDGIFYTINYGHIDEVEVQILRAAATYECGKLNHLKKQSNL